MSDKYAVFHSKDPKDMVTLTVDESVLPIALMWEGYEFVCVTEADDLDDVFKKTNSKKYEDWFRSGDVAVFRGRSYRSSSCGDVFMNLRTRKSYLIKGGFKFSEVIWI
jgi:hypothetical protein